MLAVKEDDVETVKELLAQGVDPNEPIPPFDHTALHTAAGYGALKSAKELIAAGVPVDKESKDGETPLHLAAQEGQESMIHLLKEHGADLQAQNKDGETPLHVAVQNSNRTKNVAHIEALVELRADPAATDNEGKSCYTHARFLGHRVDDLINILKKSGAEDVSQEADMAALQKAQQYQHQRSNFEVDQIMRQACRRGQNVELVKEFLKLSHDPVSTARRVLVAAALGGNVEVVKHLAQEARVEVKDVGLDETGNSMLIGAADEGALPMLKYLLQQKCHVDQTDHNGATALMAAAQKGSLEATTMLLDANADPDQKAATGWTALMHAANTGRAEVVRSLLDAKAEINTQAHSLAKAGGHTDVLKLLDTRLKLLARRAEKAAKTDGDKGLAQDTRDLDDLLADLGEGPKRPGKKKAAAKPEPKPEPKVEKVSADAKAEPKANGTAPKAVGKSQAAAPAAIPAPETAPAGKKSDAKKKAKDPKVQSLRDKLQDIAQRRAALDAEEAEVKRQLAELGY